MENILEVKNINKKYDKFSLNNVNFTIPSGKIIGLIGENGAGKSTTIKAILDLIDVDSGEVIFLGEKFDSSRVDLKEHIGVVFDEISFFKELSPKRVNDICKHLYKRWNSDTFFKYLEKFNLEKSMLIKKFSKGMRMKLNIAIALSHEAKLLILDEATTGLDPVMRDDVLDIFLDIVKDKEHSIIISSHITSDLEKIANYILFINKGNSVFLEKKETLYESFGKIIGSKKKLLETIDKKDIVRINSLHGEFDFEDPVQILIKNKESFLKKYEDINIERITIDDILLGYIKGESI